MSEIDPHSLRPGCYDASGQMIVQCDGVLNTEQRNASETLPGGRFPIPDRAHAANALARLDQAKDLSEADKAKVRARARRVLGEDRNGNKKPKK